MMNVIIDGAFFISLLSSSDTEHWQRATTVAKAFDRLYLYVCLCTFIDSFEFLRHATYLPGYYSAHPATQYCSCHCNGHISLEFPLIILSHRSSDTPSSFFRSLCTLRVSTPSNCPDSVNVDPIYSNVFSTLTVCFVFSRAPGIYFIAFVLLRLFRFFRLKYSTNFHRPSPPHYSSLACPIIWGRRYSLLCVVLFQPRVCHRPISLTRIFPPYVWPSSSYFPWYVHI